MSRSRRDVLGSLVTVGCFALAGCSSSLQQAPPGTLVIRNEHDVAHTVSIFVTTMASGSPRAERTYCTEGSTTPPAPYSGASWQYEVRFDVGADETVREDEFSPYAEHTVEVALDDTDCGTRSGTNTITPRLVGSSCW